MKDAPSTTYTIHNAYANTYRLKFEKHDDGRRVSDPAGDWRMNPAENWRIIAEEEPELPGPNARYGYKVYAEKRIAGLSHEDAMAWIHEHGTWQWR